MNPVFSTIRWIQNMWPRYIDDLSGTDLRVTEQEYRLATQSPVWRFAHQALLMAETQCFGGHVVRISNDPGKAYQLIFDHKNGNEHRMDPMNFGLQLYSVFGWMCSEQICTGRIFLGKDENGKKRFLQNRLRLIDPGTIPDAIFSFVLDPIISPTK